ncbi:major facilitator superfamily domain-containing protein [Xylariaceae sp. FL0804]|nr:major facilitator superfamily domain-containing protein [Xylariaceae sp. FL0804]
MSREIRPADLVAETGNAGCPDALSEKTRDPGARAGPRPDVFPDGGFQAWLCIAGGFCTVFASLGWVNCIGVFQAYYQTHQLAAYTPSQVAWIPATESFMLFFFGLVAGKLADDYGPRYPLLFGSVLHVFGLMMLSLSTEYYQIFLSQCVVTVAAVGSWFEKRRALAYGIMVTGAGVGGVVLPIMVDHLLAGVGFAWALRITALLLLGLLVFANIAVRSRLPPLRRPFLLRGYLAPYAEAPFRLLAVGCFFVYVGAFLPFNFIIVQADAAAAGAAPAPLADYLVPVMNAASIFGRVIPAHLGDRYGVFNVSALFTLASGAVTLALWVPASTTALIVAYAVLYGFASGLMLSIIPALVASISDVQTLGFRVGSLFALSAVGVLFGSPIAGAIVTSQDGAYTGLRVFCGVTLVVGGVFITLSRIKLVGPRLLVKK